MKKDIAILEQFLMGVLNLIACSSYWDYISATIIHWFI